MSRTLPLAAATLAVALALIPTDAPGCGIAPGKGQSVQTTSEQAVILYDEANRIEHFVRTASFSGTSADFGFLVPTPTKPDIDVADGAIYNTLAGVTKPRVEVRKVKRSKFGFGCGSAYEGTFANVGAALAPGAKADVAVVEQKRVGNLDVAVLQAETPKAIRDWLVKNGYDDRPELNDWLKPYTDGKWFLSAFKVAADVASKPNQTYALTGTTVRMSFPTDRPFYPYREPADARVINPPGGRLLRVYLLASTISSGVVGLEPTSRWEGRTVWAGQLPQDVKESVTALAKVTNPGWGANTLCLTEFEDRSSPRPGTDDVYFGPSADQSPVERPPHVVYEVIDTTSQDAMTFGGLLLVVALAFAVGLAALIRWMRKAI